RLSPKLDRFIAPGTLPEQIASGYNWAEGPCWVGSAEEGYLVWSDVPENTAYWWSEATGAQVFLRPSGFTGESFTGRESGSNGLLQDTDGSLILCQHGDRRVARLRSPAPGVEPIFETIADSYNGKRFNSPNDIIRHQSGDLYFTDPPYGLPGGQFDTISREIDFEGVYRVRPADGTVTLLAKELKRPNGLVFTPDYQRLIVANSDREHPVYQQYPVGPDGTLGAGTLFFDAAPLVAAGGRGMPDGMAMHSSGHLFATGPGGVLVFTPAGEHIGTVRTGLSTANCTLAPDERMLYITADSLILRLPLLEAK
ncbi:MAG: SMP-30/gluconolactonase/LRE family protein, partial [Bacteroidota bacterium]